MSVNIRNLDISINGNSIVHDVQLTIADGERVGLIGSSGSGKSMIAKAMMGILPSMAQVSGDIDLDGTHVVGATDEVMATLRGRSVVDRGRPRLGRTCSIRSRSCSASHASKTAALSSGESGSCGSEPRRTNQARASASVVAVWSLTRSSFWVALMVCGGTAPLRATASHLVLGARSATAS